MATELDLLPFTLPAAEEFARVEKQLAESATPGSAEYTALLRKHGALSKVVRLRNNILDLRKRVAENEEMAELDDDLAELAKDELPELRAKLEKAEIELEERLLLGDEDSSRNCIIEIRAGTGGEEAALFAADLFRMYTHYAEEHGWKVEILEVHGSDHDGYKEVVFSLQGEDVYSRMRYEGGGHRVQRVPLTEAQGRVHTSAATVAVLPEVDEVEVEVNANDLRIDTYAASGPGGQHVNRTMSAVRITHIPTGVVVACQDERSQHKNKARAMRILRSKLYELEKERIDSERSKARKTMIGSGDRSDRVRTYNFPQNRLTDHRAEITMYSLDRIMEGALDGLINALIEYDRRCRLEELARDPGAFLKK